MGLALLGLSDEPSSVAQMSSVLLCLPAGMALFDPGPELTEKRGLSLLDQWDDSTVGVVGWSQGGVDALRAAAQHPELERLALVATPYVEALPDDLDLDAITAKTLLLFGSADPETGSAHGRHWQKRLPNARLEMVPKAGHDLLQPMWHRILSHLAPRRTT
ncbi:MAG: alpha/beta hydrolase [Actinomycetota bacterium]